jgi:hypothetical protein
MPHPSKPLHVLAQMVREGLLGPLGYLLTQAMDGNEALELIKSREYLPDLILLDVQMPDKTGFEVHHNSSRSSLPLVLVHPPRSRSHHLCGRNACTPPKHVLGVSAGTVFVDTTTSKSLGIHAHCDPGYESMAFILHRTVGSTSFLTHS